MIEPDFGGPREKLRIDRRVHCAYDRDFGAIEPEIALNPGYRGRRLRKRDAHHNR
jgi:hypothetical protein